MEAFLLGEAPLTATCLYCWHVRLHAAPALYTGFNARQAPCTALHMVLCMQSPIHDLQVRLVR